MERPGYSIEATKAAWGQRARQWTTQLVGVCLEEPQRAFDPHEYVRNENLLTISPFQRLKADYVLLRTRVKAKKAKRQDVVDFFSQDETDSEHSISPLINKVKVIYEGYKPDYKGPLLTDTPFAKLFMETVWRYGETKLEGIQTDKLTRIKAFANSIGLLLMSDITDISDPRISAICALSYLHPVADTLFDSESPVDPGLLTRLDERLKGNTAILPQQPEEGVIYDLVSDIETCYPRKSFPMLYFVMNQLNAAQLESMRQKGNPSLADILSISFAKGGWATALYGAVASGEQTDRQFEWLYRNGSAQQLIDDIIDVPEDTTEGSTTLFTYTLDHEGTLDNAIAQYQHLEQNLRTLGEYPTDDPNLRQNMTLAFTDQRIAKLVALYVNEHTLSSTFQKAFKPVKPLHSWLFRRAAQALVYN